MLVCDPGKVNRAIKSAYMASGRLHVSTTSREANPEPKTTRAGQLSGPAYVFPVSKAGKRIVSPRTSVNPVLFEHGRVAQGLPPSLLAQDLSNLCTHFLVAVSSCKRAPGLQALPIRVYTSWYDDRVLATRKRVCTHLGIPQVA